MTLPAGARYELSDTACGIRRAIRSLRCEAFVIVIVDDYIGVRFIQRFPQGFYGQIVAVRAAGAEERLVPVGECAGGRMRGKIRAEPFFLTRAGFAAPHVLALAVQHDNVPRAKFVAVVALFAVAGSGTKIIEIGPRTRRLKFVVSGSRSGARFDAAPGRVIAGEILLRAARIGEVAESHNRAGDLLE